MLIHHKCLVLKIKNNKLVSNLNKTNLATCNSNLVSLILIHFGEKKVNALKLVEKSRVIEIQ